MRRFKRTYEPLYNGVHGWMKVCPVCEGKDTIRIYVGNCIQCEKCKTDFIEAKDHIYVLEAD